MGGRSRSSVLPQRRPYFCQPEIARSHRIPRSGHWLPPHGQQGTTPLYAAMGRFAAGSSPPRGRDRICQRYYVCRRRRTGGTAPGGAGDYQPLAMLALAHITDCSRCVMARDFSRLGGQSSSTRYASSLAFSRSAVYFSGCPSLGAWYRKLFSICSFIFHSKDKRPPKWEPPVSNRPTMVYVVRPYAALCYCSQGQSSRMTISCTCDGVIV